MVKKNIEVPEILLKQAEMLEQYYDTYYKPLAPLIRQCFLNTIETTVKRLDDGSVFVITGDIPAMWLRDSAAQVRPYIRFANEDEALQEILEGVIAKQAEFVCTDPYANAFNESANGKGHKDETAYNPLVFERKYEVDSLCAPIYLAYRYWKTTQKQTIFTQSFYDMLVIILETFEKEQDHSRSDYYFKRETKWKSDTLAGKGKGRPVNITGMTWSGFRPSDDGCTFNYLIPSNMMAAVAMDYAEEMFRTCYQAERLAKKCAELADDIRDGIETYGTVLHPVHGRIYAYETDGYGNYKMMDDANSPSLLSMPYLGFCEIDDALYQNTRRFILSEDNPYYKIGSIARGVGSPHTGHKNIWHIGIVMQALTSEDEDEIRSCLEMLSQSHAGTNYMHESFDPSNPDEYTRSWFAWANSLFAELLLNLMEQKFLEK